MYVLQHYELFVWWNLIQGSNLSFSVGFCRSSMLLSETERSSCRHHVSTDVASRRIWTMLTSKKRCTLLITFQSGRSAGSVCDVYAICLISFVLSVRRFVSFSIWPRTNRGFTGFSDVVGMHYVRIYNNMSSQYKNLLSAGVSNHLHSNKVIDTLVQGDLIIIPTGNS